MKGMSDGLPEKTRKIIAGIPVAELRSFVERMAAEHDDVHNEIIAAYSPEIGTGELRRFQSELDDVIGRNSDGCGFISYSNSYDFACDMESVLCRQCEALKKAKRFRLAMAVAQYVFLQLKDLAIDDSNGTIGEVAEMCCDIWRDVLPLCSMEEKKALFVWLHGFGKGESAGHTSYLKDEYADVMLMTAFPEKVFVRGNLKVLDRRIGELSAATDKGRTLLRLVGAGAQFAVAYRDDAQTECNRTGNKGLPRTFPPYPRCAEGGDPRAAGCP